jgi:hypothetical protein
MACSSLFVRVKALLVLVLVANPHVSAFVRQQQRHYSTITTTPTTTPTSTSIAFPQVPIGADHPTRSAENTLLFSSNNNNNNDQDADGAPRGEFLRGFLQSDSWSSTVLPQSVIIAKADLPRLGIFKDQSYQVQKIYLQGIQDEQVQTVELDALIIVDDDPSAIPSGYTQYLELYSPMYHEKVGFVKVTPEEIGLVNLRTEVMDSVVFALPMVGFWTAMSWTFAKLYNDRYGGDFMDALFGR